MQLQLVDLHRVYEESKFWLGLGGLLFTLFRALEWVKQIRTNDLVHIQAGVDTLVQECRSQTVNVVSELRELRADIKLLTGAFITSHSHSGD